MAYLAAKAATLCGCTSSQLHPKCCEPTVSIVRSQTQAELSLSAEHAVGLCCALVDQIIQQHSSVAL